MWMPPGPFCPACGRQELQWTAVSGRGFLFSFTILPHPKVPEAAYAPAIVELADAPGVRLISNIVAAEAETLHIEMALEVTFQPLANGLGFPVFRPKDS
jgi:uncharacterized OB-fold protein